MPGIFGAAAKLSAVQGSSGPGERGGSTAAFDPKRPSLTQARCEAANDAVCAEKLVPAAQQLVLPGYADMASGAYLAQACR